MGAWLLSILLMGIFSVVCGFTVYGITWLAKKRDKDLGEMSGGLSSIRNRDFKCGFHLFFNVELMHIKIYHL